MKEENKALRRAVEQTMKDYYDLETKIGIIQQNNLTNKVPSNPFSLCSSIWVLYSSYQMIEIGSILANKHNFYARLGIPFSVYSYWTRVDRLRSYERYP